jgi:anaerobic ribonucleoside-triphosphate reductase activating protein
MGGEWEKEALLSKIKIVQKNKLKTALYTGLPKNKVDGHLLKTLEYLKYGRWVEELGGLESSRTNQRLVNLKTGEILNNAVIEKKNKTENN